MELHPVLVVDDDPDTVMILQTLLKETLGLASISTSDTEEAFALVERFRPSLILLDVRMPGPSSSYDGMTVARKVKRDFRTRGIPIVAVSGLHDGREIAEAAGCDGFLEKPFELDAFVKAVRKHLPSESNGPAPAN